MIQIHCAGIILFLSLVCVSVVAVDGDMLVSPSMFYYIQILYINKLTELTGFFVFVAAFTVVERSFNFWRARTH